jgi:hypothetical protein
MVYRCIFSLATVRLFFGTILKKGVLVCQGRYARYVAIRSARSLVHHNILLHPQPNLVDQCVGLSFVMATEPVNMAVSGHRPSRMIRKPLICHNRYSALLFLLMTFAIIYTPPVEWIIPSAVDYLAQIFEIDSTAIHFRTSEPILGRITGITVACCRGDQNKIQSPSVEIGIPGPA